MTDVHELEKGMEMTKKEYQTRKERDAPTMLKDFLSNSEDKLRKLIADVKTAKVSKIILFVPINHTCVGSHILIHIPDIKSRYSSNSFSYSLSSVIK